MNRPMLSLTKLLLLAMLAVAPVSTIGQTSSWSQQIPCESQLNCPRFVVLQNWRDDHFPSGGAAVLDRETGLVWQRSTYPYNHTWTAALSYCRAAHTGNRLGWRLPMYEELMTLMDVTAQVAPALSPGHPFQKVAVDYYWTATADLINPTQAWAVTWGGNLASQNKMTGGNYVWCVRGGRGLDAH
jgi:hypothetical protein